MESVGLLPCPLSWDGVVWLITELECSVFGGPCPVSPRPGLQGGVRLRLRPRGPATPSSPPSSADRAPPSPALRLTRASRGELELDPARLVPSQVDFLSEFSSLLMTRGNSVAAVGKAQGYPKDPVGV